VTGAAFVLAGHAGVLLGFLACAGFFVWHLLGPPLLRELSGLFLARLHAARRTHPQGASNRSGALVIKAGVRALFVIYVVAIAAGLVYFAVIGLSQH
jgi:hypothetical protein